MHMNRFVVFQLEDEWLVTYGDRKQVSFTTREEAEQSAFHAADAMASSGHAVSVLIMPFGLPGKPIRAPAKRDDDVGLSRSMQRSLKGSHASRGRDCRQGSNRA
jgi:hypothetical protein